MPKFDRLMLYKGVIGIGVTIGVLVLGVWRLRPDTSPTRRIEEVLKAEIQCGQQLAIHDDIELYVLDLRAIDTTKCPMDFRQAFENFIQACEGAKAQRQSDLIGGIGPVAGFPERPGTESRYAREIADRRAKWNAHVANMERALAEVRRVASEYGVQ